MVLQKHGGAATLATFYNDIPALGVKHNSQDYEKMIRGYLSRMKNQGVIKRIGLSTYALVDYKVQNDLYESILNEKITKRDFVALPSKDMHGHLQGMLIEIGNMKGLDTYSPDKAVVFNGKSLGKITSCESIPAFTYADRLKKIAQIDVIWFKDGYPIKTFDVEHSTDFTKALVRGYQLKYFRADCFMIADAEKEKIFDDRIATKPFDEIKNIVKFLPNSSVFSDYQSILNFTKFKSQSDLL